MDKKFQLSIVATARNDNHGENFLYRMQHFVDGFIGQCKKHDLSAELIIVEWNPPPETPPLSQVLKFPQDMGPCIVRFICVPQTAHAALSHSDKLPLFQMIGKNVGIRRAQGKFVLATNIDILFSDHLIWYLKNKLKSGHLYRADRLDVPSQLPVTASLDEILDFCDKNYFRINGKFGTKIKIKGRWQHQHSFWLRVQKSLPKIKARSVILSLLKLNFPIKIYEQILIPLYQTFENKIIFKLHTNACGDFTLLSSHDWERLKGYPEWEMYSWHIDSVLLHQAFKMGIKEVDLPKKQAIYHIEHGLGSGFTPEAANALFKRLEQRGIPHLTDPDLDKIVEQINRSPQDPVFNKENWGMSDLKLEETRIA
jgi:hypothetical protein